MTIGQANGVAGPYNRNLGTVIKEKIDSVQANYFTSWYAASNIYENKSGCQ